jgi:hypothetical protein
MTKKIIVTLIALAFILSVIIPALADDKANKNAKQATQLVAVLPDSDGIMSVNVKRLLNEALPQILSANQPKLNGILGKLDEVKTKTGIDLSRFEQVAIGVKANQISPSKFEFEPVILARGSYDAGALVAVAKLASKGKYREEKIGGQTIYIFSAKEIAEENKPQSNGSFMDKMFDKMLGSFNGEFALTSYDTSTLAFGSVPRVREVIESKTRVNSQLLDLVYRNQNAVMSFGANMPKGMASFFDLDNEEIDKNINVIKQIYGSMNVNGNNTNVSLTAKTLKEQEAVDLETFMKGIAEVGKVLIGSSKGADKKVYARMIENAKISHQGNEVMLDLQIPQSDIDVIVGEKK